MKFIIYRDRKKEWRWRLISKGRVVADSGEGYKRRTQVTKMISRIILGPHKVEELSRYAVIAAALLLFGCDNDQTWYDTHPPKPDPNCTPPCSESSSMSSFYNSG